MTNILRELATFGFWIWASLAVWVPLWIVATTTYGFVRNGYEQAKGDKK